MLDTAFTRLVGCEAPIQLAGMGAVSTPALVAAVSEAGGLGMLSLVGGGPGDVGREVGAVRALTSRPFGANFLAPFLDVAALETAAATCPLVEVFYGDPDADVVARAHAGGARVSWQVGSADEARAAAGAGCDLVVAQGVEAGGHVRGTTPLLPLLDAVLARVDVPVVAAGGIATARGVAAVLAAGAAGARIGTRFVTCAEADAHPDYVAALLAAGADDTVLTETFDEFWPAAPHRVLRSCVDAAVRAGAGRSPLPPTRSTPGPVEAMALYAGQGVAAVTRVESAGDVVRDLVDGAARLLAAVG